MSIKAIIVDDEPHARRYLGDLVAGDADIELLAALKNGREALTYLKENSVDLVFLDIHMPGINGLDVLQQLPKDSAPIIVFTTAYDQYAITAFESAALDYLLKPFDEKRLAKALDRVKEQISFKEQSAFHQKIASLYQDFKDAQAPQLTEFIIKERGFEKVVKTRDIHWIEANSVYAELYTENEKHLYRVALNLLESELPSEFMRIHRSIIVNKDYIQRTVYQNNNTYLFKMKTGKELLSSRSYKAEIMRKLS